MMDAPEPDRPATLEPLPLPGYEAEAVTVPLRVLTRVLGPGEIAVGRWAGARPGAGPDPGGELHIAAHEDTREVDRLELADVIFREGGPGDPRFGSPSSWTAEVLRRHRGCSLAAYVTGPSECVVRVRGEQPLRMVAVPGAEAEVVSGADPAAYASALHAWLATDSPGAVTTHARLARAVTDGLVVRTGDRLHRVRVVPLSPSGSAD
jgi:hypothetical protein